MRSKAHANHPPRGVAYRPTRHRAHVFFSEGSAGLRDRSRSLLDGLAGWLSTEPLRRIALHAHANTGGDPGTARALAAERVLVVRAALLAAGVPEQQIDDNASISLHLASSAAPPVQVALCRRVDVFPLPEADAMSLARRPRAPRAARALQKGVVAARR